MLNSLRPKRLGIIRRRGWVVIGTTVVVTLAAYVYAHHRPPAYAASGYVVVNSGANAQGPGSANEASSLATTYAGLIPKDSSVIAYVSGQLHQPQSSVRSSISVFTSNSTAILQVRYTGGSRSLAISGAKAVAQAIVGPSPVTQAIPSGSVLLVSLPTSASVASSARSTAVPIGFLLGVLLGVIVMVAWERFDPRIDQAKELAEVVGVPVTEHARLNPQGVRALRRRWLDLISERQEHSRSGPTGLPDGNPTVNIALVAVAKSSSTLAGAVAQRLTDSSNEAPLEEARATTARYRTASVWLYVFGDPRGGDGGSLVTLRPDFVILVVPAGTRARDVVDVVEALGAFGMKPEWAIMTSVPSPPAGARRIDLLGRTRPSDPEAADEAGNDGGADQGSARQPELRAEVTVGGPDSSRTQMRHSAEPSRAWSSTPKDPDDSSAERHGEPQHGEVPPLRDHTALIRSERPTSVASTSSSDPEDRVRTPWPAGERMVTRDSPLGPE